MFRFLIWPWARPSPTDQVKVRMIPSQSALFLFIFTAALGYFVFALVKSFFSVKELCYIFCVSIFLIIFAGLCRMEIRPVPNEKFFSCSSLELHHAHFILPSFVVSNCSTKHATAKTRSASSAWHVYNDASCYSCWAAHCGSKPSLLHPILHL